MTRTKAIFAVFSLAAVTLAGSLSAQTALKDVTRIRDGIIFIGMAYEISEECSTIDGRLFRAINYLESLKDHALELGYSEDDIKAYVDDEAEKARLERIARQQLAALGVVEGQEATYCAAGQSQIAANTRVGWMLR